jgi:DNA-binding protein H-NS
MDLNELSLAELKKLQKSVAAAITNFADRKKAHARAELEAKARELGFELAALIGTNPSGKRTRAPAAAKYRNPADANDTWSGRGRRPKWLVAAIASGKSEHDFAI